MADAPEKAAGKGLDFLKQKAGPLPLWVWLGAGIGIWYYMQRQQKSAAAAAASTGMVTDPAGNQCASGDIDSLTGYCTGTSEDLAALTQQQQAASGSPTTGAASSGTSGAQTYADDNAWGIAAVNYLVGLGIDATTANQAVQQYLASALGPPPTLPAPTISNPAPVTTTPGSGSGSGGTGTGPPVKTPAPPAKTPAPPAKTPAPPAKTPTPKTSAPAPTGLVVSQKHSTSLQVKWNASKGATGYHVLCTDMATKKITNQFDVAAAQTTANCGGLTPSHSYVIDVWAEPESGGVGTGPHAEVSTTLPKTG
jgi:hypothetical protein